MGRPRLFDHEEARARWLAGETQPEIAASYGVTAKAVCQAIQRLDPAKRAEMNEQKRLYMQRHLRKPCVRGCGRLTWHQPDRPGVCLQCSALERATTVRETTLACCECGEWKPDAAFPREHAAIARRGRHAVCRSCQASARQRTRVARMVPCVRCGTPRTNPDDTGAKQRGTTDTGLCRDCYRASVTKAVA